MWDKSKTIFLTGSRTMTMLSICFLHQCLLHAYNMATLSYLYVLANLFDLYQSCIRTSDVNKDGKFGLDGNIIKTISNNYHVYVFVFSSKALLLSELLLRVCHCYNYYVAYLGVCIFTQGVAVYLNYNYNL